MRFSTLLVLAAASVGLTNALCDKAAELADCVTPFGDDALNCSPTDKNCVCSAAQGQMDCYAKFCPDMTYPGGDEVASVCGGSSSGSGSSGSGSGSGSGNGNGGDNNAAGMLLAPAGGLLAAMVAVVALL